MQLSCYTQASVTVLFVWGSQGLCWILGKSWVLVIEERLLHSSSRGKDIPADFLGLFDSKPLFLSSFFTHTCLLTSLKQSLLFSTSLTLLLCA